MSPIYKFLFPILLMLISFSVYSQAVTFGFEVSDGSYTDSDYGDWFAANSITYGSGKEHSGSKALTFDDDAGAYLLYQGSDNGGKDGGLGEVSFYYRHWDGSAATVKFKVQYNQSGAGWTDIGSEVTVTSTTYQQFTATVNLSGNDILFRVLSTAYAERLLIDDIVLTDYGVSTTSVNMTDDGLISENAEDGELITVTIHSDTFTPSLNIANWTTFNLPGGVSISNLLRINDTVATFQFTGNRNQDYDANITNFSISISHLELVTLSTGSLSATSGVVFTANNDVEAITLSFDGAIVEDAESGEVISVSLTGGTFALALNSSNWVLIDGPVGVSVGSVTRLTDTTASIDLSGNASSDYDSDITDAAISIDYSQIEDVLSGSISTNTGVIFTAVIEPKPTLQATNIVFPSVGASQITLHWTRGNGEYCLVIASENAAVSEYPVDGSNFSYSTVFGNGFDLGNSNFVVYKGTGNSATITGLDQGKEYYFRVFEFNNQTTNSRFDTTAATGNPSFSTTKPNDVTNFNLDCISKSTAHLSWTLPTGIYSGIIIAARQSTNPVHTISSGQGSALIPSTTFGLGTAFGSTIPNSYVVYNGTGNSVTINGLIEGAQYTFKAYVYYDSIWSGGVAKTQQTAEIDEVTSLMHYAPNHELVINWTNPDFNCPDEVMVVMKSGSAVTALPSGNGSTYIASSVFGSGTDIGSGEFVIYKGQLDGVTATGLTNGVNYHFTIFVRDDTAWSNGVSDLNTPTDISILFASDLAVVGINTDFSSGQDEISFVCFDTLKTGSSIDLTDNGWERSNTGYWGSTEGVIRITRTGVDVLPGEVITIRGSGHLLADYSIIGLADNGWVVSSLNGNYDFNLNSTDQLWFMQYGNWSNGGSSQMSSYSGNVLYGWTATGWAGDIGHGTVGSTSYSALYPFGECFNTNVVNTTNKDKVKYTGPSTATTQRDWINRIKDAANWSGYSSTALYNAGGPNYSAGIQISINSSSYSEGEWIGDVDSNWFNCANWSNLSVPSEITDVAINIKAERICVIDNQADYSDDHSDSAICKNLTITDSTLFFQNASDVLTIENDIVLNGGNLELNDASLILNGNWLNTTSSAFKGENGTLILSGETNQIIQNTVNTEIFKNIIMDNQFHVNLNSPLETDLLTFIEGKIFIENNNLFINDSITNYSSDSYVVTEDDTLSVGFLVMSIGATHNLFPIGNSNGYNPLNVSLSTGNAVFKARVFNSVFERAKGGNALTGDLVDKTWIFEPITSGTYTAEITLNWNLADETSGFSVDRGSAGIVFNDFSGTGTGWANWAGLVGGGSVQGTNPFYITKSNITAFGAFAVGSKCTIRKPITSKIYHY